MSWIGLKQHFLISLNLKLSGKIVQLSNSWL